MKFWNNNISDIQKLLGYLISIWKPTGGYSFNAKNNIAYHEFMNSINQNELNRSAVNKTLAQMKVSSKNSCEEFLDIYTKIKEEQNQKKPIKQKWTFYIPIDAEFEDNIKFPISITILGHKYLFVKNIPYGKKIFFNYPVRLFEFQEEVFAHINNKNFFLCVLGSGVNLKSAWEEIALSFNVLRGIIEFSFGFRNFVLISPSRPRAKIPHPRWIIIRDQQNTYGGDIFNLQSHNMISKFRFTQKKS